MTTTIPISQIRRDGGTQTRAAISYQTTQEYLSAMLDGAIFPPIVVFYDGTDYWLADGFHRVEAARQAGITELAATVATGTQRDAVLHAAGANSTHGLQRTIADKRRAVELLLRDSEWGQWSDREIAKRYHVSHTFVASMRPHTGNVASAERLYTRNGQTQTMDTAEIGKTAVSALSQVKAVTKRPSQGGQAEDMLGEDDPQEEIDDKFQEQIVRKHFGVYERRPSPPMTWKLYTGRACPVCETVNSTWQPAQYDVLGEEWSKFRWGKCNNCGCQFWADYGVPARYYYNPMSGEVPEPTRPDPRLAELREAERIVTRLLTSADVSKEPEFVFGLNKVNLELYKAMDLLMKARRE